MLCGPEELWQVVGVTRVVHANDPLGPGEILDGTTDVGELPVHQRADTTIVDQDVLRSEVAVDDHVALPRETGHRCGIDLLKLPKEGSEQLEHLPAVTGFDHVLTVRPGHLDERHANADASHPITWGTGSRPARLVRQDHSQRDRSPASAPS